MFEDTQVIRNTGTAPIKVYLEPWASEYVLSAGESLRFVGQSEQEGKFEIADHGEIVGVYCWPGSSIQVFNGDELLDDWPVLFDTGPPSEMSMRSFIESAFGGPGGPYRSSHFHQSSYCPYCHNACCSGTWANPSLQPDCAKYRLRFAF